MLKKSACSLILCVSATSAFAQASVTPIQADPRYSAYLQDSRGAIVRSANGFCWRSGYWTPADAVAGCDGELVPPIAKPTAPDIVSPVAVKPIITPVMSPKQCDFTVTLNSDQTFAFNNATLGSTAKKRIDLDVLSRLTSCAKVDSILITGYTDRLGSPQYNQKLSEKRANVVAAYLKNKDVSTEINTMGAGKTQPIKACPHKLPRQRLIDCLAPNRRVVIEVHGLAN